MLGRPGPAGSGIGRYVECVPRRPEPAARGSWAEGGDDHRAPALGAAGARLPGARGEEAGRRRAAHALARLPQPAPRRAARGDAARPGAAEEPRGLPAHGAAPQAPLPVGSPRPAGDGRLARRGRRRRADARPEPRAHRRGAAGGAARLRAGGGARELLARLGLPAHFLLGRVARPIDPRKGVEPLVDAVAASDGPPLVLAGNSAAAAGDRLARPGRVLVLGRVSDSGAEGALHSRRGARFPFRGRGLRLPPAWRRWPAARRWPPTPPARSPRSWRAVEERSWWSRGHHARWRPRPRASAGTQAQPPTRSWQQVAVESAAVFRAAAA